MSRMIDRLLACHRRPSLDGIGIGESDLRSAEVLNISNVATYLYSQKKESWDTRDFPCLAPPWKSFWAEYTTAGGYLCPDPGCGIRHVFAENMTAMGCLFFADEIAPEQRFAHRDRYSLSKPGQLVAAKWEMLAVQVYEAGGGSAFGVGMINGLLIAPDGRLVSSSGNYSEQLADRCEHCKNMMHFMMVPFFLSLSFLHCRNVHLVDKVPDPRLSRAYQKRHGQPLVRYKVLEIEPMKRILSTAGRVQQSGLKVALHICRGHFKDYRERGLFGKNKGIYWWDHALRGHAEQGVVVKDYKLKVGTE